MASMNHHLDVPAYEGLDLNNPAVLLDTLRRLRQAIYEEGQATLQQWQAQIQQPEFFSSACNLAYYLALRHRDLRPLQTALMPWGLSSLGRIEARVMPNLDAVIATLNAVVHPDASKPLAQPQLSDFFEGTRLLQKHTESMFGKAQGERRVRIMVTLPTEAATQYEFVQSIIQRGADCIRINCAHDTAVEWQAMIDHVHRAEQEIGRSCKIHMDLGGPKPRTGEVFPSTVRSRVFPGDHILLARSSFVSESPCSLPPNYFLTSCSIPEILDHLTVGNQVWIDDGKIGATVVNCAPDQFLNVQTSVPSGILLSVTHTSPKGSKLLPNKGLNFPDTVLRMSPLTNKDYQDLDFVAAHADLIGYSFVQTAADIALLQRELERRLQECALPAIVAKLETREAVQNLPELIVQAAGKQPFGVMIARGDLAVEIGYQRLAEIQEEILWLCEAAHVPVIWATQVLESLVKKGVPSRGEITDAAMAERAECVMLNKGAFAAEAVTILDDVLTRMQAHQSKKTPQLRALRSW
jgi:pyruvate kinase